MCWHLIPIVRCKEGRNLIWPFRGRAWRKWSGLDKAVKVEAPWLNSGGFLRKGRETWIHTHTHTHTHTLSPARWCPVPLWDSVSKKSSPNAALYLKNHEVNWTFFFYNLPVCDVVTGNPKQMDTIHIYTWLDFLHIFLWE
jgi:hypothetical protein